jgi:hypothetical protein
MITQENINTLSKHLEKLSAAVYLRKYITGMIEASAIQEICLRMDLRELSMKAIEIETNLASEDRYYDFSEALKIMHDIITNMNNCTVDIESQNRS